MIFGSGWSVSNYGPCQCFKGRQLSLPFFWLCSEGRFVVTVRSYRVNILCAYRGSSVDSRHDA